MTYIDLIKEILRESSKPKSAMEISSLIMKKGHRGSRKRNPVTPDQIRNRIRKYSGDDIQTLKTSPLTYHLISSKSSLWVLKSVNEDDKASQTIDSYEDRLAEYYNYDNFVANSKQIAAQDMAILIDKNEILGFAKIDNIAESEGTKTIRRCPQCPSTTIDKRKTKTPTYRCNKGHEFEYPIEEEKNAIKYRAHFAKYIPISNMDNSLQRLKPFYSNGYNQNMSMQRLANEALSLFEGIEIRLNSDESHNNLKPLLPNEGYIQGDLEPYKLSDQDDREITLRSIKLRRGQQKFREILLKRYNSTCVITGCKIVEILEAAHIKPYRGINDNHPSNGLLLRADMHTLFDLNLVAIEPEALKIYFHEEVKDEYKEYEGNEIIEPGNSKPSTESLTWRWDKFLLNKQ